MPLDKVVISHLDDMDVIEDKALEEIDGIVNKINVDALLESPLGEMVRVVDLIRDVMVNSYMPEAIQNGVNFAKSITKDKEILIVDTNDPNFNTL